ncbi:MAG: hypothetical protein GY898_23200 [Proteobacteria bacterium]|nr:hypothetical protein [Pseudomonadota bacterium]
MSPRTFRVVLAGALAVVALSFLVSSVTNGTPAPAPPAPAPFFQDAWVRGLSPTGPNPWRTFNQHAPDTNLQAGIGNFVDTFPVYNFGRNPDVDTAAVTEDIWTIGGDFVFPSAAEPVVLVSTSTDDDGDPAGTGAQTVIVQGLDANYVSLVEIVTMDGTTPVATTQTFLRVNRAYVDEAGTGFTNLGDIDAEQQTSTLPLFRIPATKGQATNAAYTVPAGFSLLVTRLYGSIGRSQATAATLEFVVRPFGKAARTVGYAGLHSQGTTWSNQLYPIPAELPEKTDLKMRVEVSANNSDVNAGFEGYLVITGDIGQ